MHANTITFLAILQFLLIPLMGFAQEKRSGPVVPGTPSSPLFPQKLRTPKLPSGTLQGPRAPLRNGQRSSQAHPQLVPHAFPRTATASHTPHHVRRADAQGLPTWLESPQPQAARAQLATPEDKRAAALTYLQEVADLMRIQRPSEEFVVKDMVEEEAQTHLKLSQVFQGLPVYGSEIWVHLGADGHALMNGRYRATPGLERITPTLSAEQAMAAGRADLSQKTLYRELNEEEQQWLSYTGPEAELIIYPLPEEEALRLAYHITFRPNFVERWEYFLDAHTGEVLNAYDHTCSIGPRTVNGTHLNGEPHQVNTFELSNGQFILLDASKSMYKGAQGQDPKNGDGYIITVDMKNTHPNDPQFEEITSGNNSWSQLELSAHVNASIAYDRFEQTFGWQSINGQGGDIISFINVADENGGGLDNAFWNGAAMFYGNGNQAFFPLAGSIDVGGHEMGHGVIQALANLEYQGESGALNESFADIFGVMADPDDWRLGEDVVNPNIFRSGALRDMSNPRNGGNSLNDNGYQPDNYDDRYQGSENNGGVHINSGINNRAYYLVATALNLAQAQQIYFRALQLYLTRSSQFIDMRLAAERSANDLYGANAAAAVRNAYDQVRILDTTGGTGTQTNPDVEANPGDDYIMVLATDPSSQNTLFRTDPAVQNIVPLSSTPFKRPISIRDDGDFGYFVGTDAHIREIITNPDSQTDEQIISSSPFWDNVAISKDGNRLAAISIEVDTSIYVQDLVSGNFVKYRLYNPTTSQDGIQTGEVFFADAIQWDFSGQYLLYDAYNIIRSPTGQDLDYWDVGVIRVWDNASNSFGDGFISKIFTQLPEGVSLGNAKFSQTSTNVITLEYWDQNELNDPNDDEHYILAADIETGQVQTLFQNNTFGFPSYSRLDDRVVFSVIDNVGDTIVAAIPMAADRLTPQGQASGLVGPAKWPVWYAVGERDISTDRSANEVVQQFQAFPNPFSESLSLHLSLGHSGELRAGVYNLMGQQVGTLAAWHGQRLGAGVHRLEWVPRDLPPGVYLLKLWVNGKTHSLKLVRQ